jgi:hypothetical protein
VSQVGPVIVVQPANELLADQIRLAQAKLSQISRCLNSKV